MPLRLSGAAVHASVTFATFDQTPGTCVVDAKLLAAPGGVPSTTNVSPASCELVLSPSTEIAVTYEPSLGHEKCQSALRTSPCGTSPSTALQPLATFVW